MTMLKVDCTHFIVHPTVPFSGNLRGVISHMNVWCIFHPSITAIEIVIIFIVFISILVCTDQSTNFQFIMPEKVKMKCYMLVSIDFINLTFYYITQNDIQADSNVYCPLGIPKLTCKVYEDCFWYRHCA